MPQASEKTEMNMFSKSICSLPFLLYFTVDLLNCFYRNIILLTSPDKKGELLFIMESHWSNFGDKLTGL
jgi:hypothetical protein